MKKEAGKIYAILGDSVSTFAGCTPKNGVFYDGWVKEATGVKTPEDTWWMQVIREKKGVVGANNSYAGSLVSGNLSTSGTAENRLRELGEKGKPDVILIAMGTNDWGFCVLPQEFAQEYRRMIGRLKCLYPQAESGVLRCCGEKTARQRFLMRNRLYRKKCTPQSFGRRLKRRKYIFPMWPAMV